MKHISIAVVSSRIEKARREITDLSRSPAMTIGLINATSLHGVALGRGLHDPPNF
jgi:hypothetical protein